MDVAPCMQTSVTPLFKPIVRKSEGVFHTVCYHSQMCVREKTELLVCDKTKGELNQIFRRSLISYKEKATIKNA